MTEKTYIIIDFEATCTDSDEFPRDEMEIIEWGVVAVDGKILLPVGEFQSFARPVRNPVLTEFCKRLTNISQNDVGNAPLFPETLMKFSDWLSQYDYPIFCSWGNYDKNQLVKDCSYHQLEYPFKTDYHVNLKKRFSQKMGLKNPSMDKALRITDTELTGEHHRGIDDARNIAKLMPLIFK